MSAVGATATVRRDRWLADGLFWIQVAFAAGFGIAQYLTMRETVAGVSYSWMGLWLGFLLVNLGLAVNAMRQQPGRVIGQTVIIYAAWSLSCVFIFGYLVVAGGQWNFIDTVTTVVTALGILGTVLVARRHALSLSDPYVRAAVAVCCKAIPQVTLAWNIARHGGDGLAAYTLLSGHVTINLRLWQVFLSIREAGWDRNRIGIAVGEAANELSWIVTTVVWIIVV